MKKSITLYCILTTKLSYNMNKFLLFFILPIIAFSFTGCDDEDDVMDTKLIKGQWQLVSQDSSDRDCIYNFTTQSEHTWSWGILTTYYLTASGNPVHDKVYDWHVSDPNNYDTVYLDITLQGELDSNDAWEQTEQYIVETLTSSEMILRKVEVGDSKTRLRFIRRNDLPLP